MHALLSCSLCFVFLRRDCQFLARDEDIDVRHYEAVTHHIAGEDSLHPNVLAMAMSKEHQSNIGRVGGRRGSTLVGTAQQARAQLKTIAENKNAPGSLRPSL